MVTAVSKRNALRLMPNQRSCTSTHRLLWLEDELLERLQPRVGACLRVRQSILQRSSELNQFSWLKTFKERAVILKP